MMQTCTRCAGVLILGVLIFSGCDDESDDDVPEMRIQSVAFGQEEAIPTAYTCNGSHMSPPLSFSIPPDETQSLAVVMEEPEHVMGLYTHWLIWGLPTRTVVPENVKRNPPEGAVFGTADDEETVGYLAPCPPEGKTHEFIFRVYALDKKINLEAGANRDALDTAMAGHILAEGELVGLVTGR